MKRQSDRGIRRFAGSMLMATAIVTAATSNANATVQQSLLGFHLGIDGH